MNTGALRDPVLTPVDAPTTFCLTMRLEDTPTAVRVGFADDTALGYAIDAVAACTSTTYNDGAHPTGGAPWARLASGATEPGTSVAAGPTGTARSLVVPGNGGGPRVPALTWTDWTPIASVPPDDGSGLPILFIRVSAAAWMAPRSCNGVNGFSGSAAARGRDMTLLSRVGKDLATLPQGRSAGFRPIGVSPVYCVQYRSPTPGATLLWGGDSHFSGTTTLGGILAFPLQSCLDISTPSLPLAAANYAWAGSPSVVFLPLLERMLEACRPQILLLQGWTANDGAEETAAIAYAERVLRLAEQARARGALTILVTHFPRETLVRNAAEAAVVERLRRQQLALDGPEMPVLDATPVLADPDRPYAYRPGLSDDDVHPNAAGHAALSAALTPLLRASLARLAANT